EQLVRRIPPPKGDPQAPLQALIIDSWFDNYVGVVSLVRVMNGSISMGSKIRVWSTGRAYTVDKLGRFTPKSVSSETLETGDVGGAWLGGVMNGWISMGANTRVWSTGRAYTVDKLGRFTPKSVSSETLETGEVGFVIAGIKDINGAPVGDTITLDARPCSEPLAGFKQVQPRVFAGLFPVRSDDYEAFRDALAKLKLNDSAQIGRAH